MVPEAEGAVVPSVDTWKFQVETKRPGKLEGSKLQGKRFDSVLELGPLRRILPVAGFSVFIQGLVRIALSSGILG